MTLRADCAGPHPVPPNPLLAQRPTAAPAQAPATGPHHADKGHPEILPQGSTNWCRISTDAPRDEGARSSLQGLQHVFRGLERVGEGSNTLGWTLTCPIRAGVWTIGRLIQLS
jgi:hypothetical protein